MAIAPISSEAPPAQVPSSRFYQREAAAAAEVAKLRAEDEAKQQEKEQREDLWGLVQELMYNTRIKPNTPLVHNGEEIGVTYQQAIEALAETVGQPLPSDFFETYS